MGAAVRRLASASGAFSEVLAPARTDPFPDHADVVIDFSRPEQTRKCLEWCQSRGVPLVIGTTGLDADDHRSIAAASEQVAVCQEANFSLGVHVLYALAEKAAVMLGEGFDSEVLEVHHRRKADAPSGTALELGRRLAAGREPGRVSPSGSGRSGPREHGEIGVQALRGGDVAGEHTVFFLGDGERLELTHRAGGRELFARGALRAAVLLSGRPAGLYGLADLVGGSG